jgi:PBP1b-binding outer membrane lipoprotein LpoB
MKKIILIVMLTLVLSGCQKKPENNTSGEVKKNVFTSIRDAVTRQLTLKCEYADEDGQVTTTYIKGQMVRMVGAGTDKVKVEGLMREGKFYLWNNENKQGMVLEMAKLTESGSAKMGEKQINSIDDVIGVLEEKKDKCSVTSEGASMFEVPADVKFTNTSGLLGQ